MLERVTAAAGAARTLVFRFADDRKLRRLRRKALAAPRHVPGEIELGGFRVRYPDLLSLHVEYRQIFGHRIYDFESAEPAPRVMDGGSHVGQAAMYTKRRHPAARDICFEPDPTVRAMLEHNIAVNGPHDVAVVPKALAADEGAVRFAPDGADGGRVVEGSGGVEIATTRLSGFLDLPKLNIEALELAVPRDSADRLRRVGQTVVEYHGWPEQPQGLGEILTLLDGAGFRYLVNGMDEAINPAVRPPFRLDAGTRWFALVYARRDDLL